MRRGSAENREARGRGNRREKKRLKKTQQAQFGQFGIFAKPLIKRMTSNWPAPPMVATGEWLLCINQHSLQSLQIHPRKPPNASRKRGTETLHRLLILSVTPFQGTSQSGTSLPCLPKSALLPWFCSQARKAGRGTGGRGGEPGDWRKEGRRNSSARLRAALRSSSKGFVV